MKILRALLALALLLTPLRALAQEAKALTADCVITSGKVKTTAAHDGDYTTAWRSERVRRPYLEFELPEGETAGYLYVCFTEMPQSWAVEERVDGKWRVVAEGGTDYLHALVELNGQNHFRIVENSGVTTRLKFNEVFVFGEGELPDWVQRWQPTAEKADLLVLATHPDDELIFFGGTIPTYAVEREKSVVVAYMSGASAARRSELLNGLWHMGVRQYPVIGPFGDTYSTNMAVIYDQWGRERVRKYVMGLIRRYKPDVVVTHDRGGEYGHGAQGHRRRERLLRGKRGESLRAPRALRGIRRVDGQKALSAHGRGERDPHGLERAAVRHGRQDGRTACAGGLPAARYPAKDELCRHRRGQDGQRQIFARLYDRRARYRRRGFL